MSQESKKFPLAVHNERLRGSPRESFLDVILCPLGVVQSAPAWNKGQTVLVGVLIEGQDGDNSLPFSIT